MKSVYLSWFGLARLNRAYKADDNCGTDLSVPGLEFIQNTANNFMLLDIRAKAPGRGINPSLKAGLRRSYLIGLSPDKCLRSQTIKMFKLF